MAVDQETRWEWCGVDSPFAYCSRLFIACYSICNKSIKPIYSDVCFPV